MQFWLLIGLGAWLLSQRMKQFAGPGGMEPILKPLSTWGPLLGTTAPYDPAFTADSTIGSSGYAGGPSDPLSTYQGAEQSITKQYTTAFLDPGNRAMYPARPVGTGPVQPGGYPMTYPERVIDPIDMNYVPEFNWWMGDITPATGLPSGSRADQPTRPPDVPPDWVYGWGWGGPTWMPPGAVS